MDNKEKIYAIIRSIGGSSEVAEAYYSLLLYGPQTISQLSRNSHIERTKVYRLLEKLQQLHLIEIELQPKRSLIKASPITSLKPLVAQRQHALEEAIQHLPMIESQFAKKSLISPLTKVQFYQGKEGAKQMLWNQTKAQGETLSILYQNMQSHTGEEFYSNWARRCNEQNLTFRSVVSDAFVESQKRWADSESSGLLKNWHGRYIPDETHSIRFWTCIYNNVVAYFSWHEHEIYGIEIYNQDIADANRDFFESLWKIGVTIPENT